MSSIATTFFQQDRHALSSGALRFHARIPNASFYRCVINQFVTPTRQTEFTTSKRIAIHEFSVHLRHHPVHRDHRSHTHSRFQTNDMYMPHFRQIKVFRSRKYDVHFITPDHGGGLPNQWTIQTCARANGPQFTWFALGYGGFE